MPAARHQGFARTAEDPGVTRAAVAHPVRMLEKHLDVPLFDRRHRGTRRVRLVPARFHDGLLARISHQRSSRGRRGAVVTGRTVTRNIVKRTPLWRMTRQRSGCWNCSPKRQAPPPCWFPLRCRWSRWPHQSTGSVAVTVTVKVWLAVRPVTSVAVTVMSAVPTSRAKRTT